MRSVARIKLGYYPLPPSEGSRLRQLLCFPAECTSVLDPCAGTGAALLQITEGADVERHAVELDAQRAQATREIGINTIHGNLFDVQGKSGSFSLLYLNPPYDAEVASFGNRRMELLFLQKTFRWLVIGGVLVMVVPHGQLEVCTDLLANDFTSFQVLRLTEPESERFDQVVLLAVRARIRDTDYRRNREQLIAALWPKDMPALTGQEAPYLVPPTGPATLEYRGLPLDDLEDLVITSSAWAKARPYIFPREEASVGRPITPLHGGHVGLLCTAGLLNGVFGSGEDRHIARWRTVKHVTTFTEKIEGYTEIHKRERFSNELALVYENGKTLILTDEKKKEKADDAERTPEARAA
jgi:predicted RNA methylase